MPYGTIKVDNITFDNGGTDKLITVSGLFFSTSGALTVTGTISGGNVTAPTATFTTLTGTTTAGTTATFTSGSFTSVTGTTVTGTTANFASGVFTTQVSGTTITGTTVATTTGSFVSLTGTTATFTSGIIASGTAALPSLAILSDPNTGIYSPGADQLAISTNGTGRLFVDASGKVGINTSPARDLTVYGSSSGLSYLQLAHSAASGASRGFEIILNATESYFINRESGPTIFVNGGNERMRLTSAGLLGLGTSNPSGLLTLAWGSSTGINSGLIGQVTNAAGANNGYRIGLRTSSNSTNWCSIDQVFTNLGVNADTYIAFTTTNASNSAAERMRLTSTGLGIGTTSPGATLHISAPVNVATANPVLKVVRNNNTGSVSGHPEIGIDVSIPTTFNDASAAYGVKVFTTHNLGGEHYAGYFEAAGSTYSNGIGVYAKTTHTDTNGPGYQPAVLADAYSTITTSDSGYAVALEARTNNYINNENIRVTSLYTGSSNQFAMRIIRNATDIGGIRTNTTSTSYRTSQTAGFNGVDGNTLSFETSSLERARIDSSGRLLVGTSSARSGFFNTTNTAIFQVEGATNDVARFSSFTYGRANSDGPLYVFAKHRGASIGGTTVVVNGDELGAISFQGADGTEFVEGVRIAAYVDGTPGANDLPSRLVFSTTLDGASSPTERMRITNSGSLRIGQSTSDAPGVAGDNTVGTAIGGTGYVAASRDGNIALYVNRKTNDGDLVLFYQDATQEGSISVSGTTVSYNGAHLSRWSQLPGGATREEILRGTVLSNIDEMCGWGEEANEQLNRMKVSDVEGDKNVSGVFQDWDDDDDTYTDDFYCAMTGDFIIRIAEGVTVERGDLLMSAGDGTAKPQDDDIIRSKTIAKVTSTHVTCTYEDGSYCVPCVLMAC